MASRSVPTDPRAIRVALLGCGVVGEGVLRLLAEHEHEIQSRLGTRIEVRRILARSAARARSVHSAASVSYDADSVLADPDIDVFVELMGGLTPAYEYVGRAIDRGAAVVTANKALLAERGHELIERAESKGVDLYFEASVGGGIPIIRVLREAFASDRIEDVRGIVNGTSNYILSRMQHERMSFADALKEAQAAGYAEADPTLDVSGGDAAHKLVILSTMAFGARVAPSDVLVEGIDTITATDIHFAERFGYVIKLLAIGQLARADGDAAKLDLRVHPALLPRDNVLANINGALNAIAIRGTAVGPALLSGLGAGAMPTAVSVVSDLVDVGRNLLSGARGRVPQRAFRGDALQRYQLITSRDRRGRFYLRFSVLDRPGVLAKIAGVLGAFDVSIEQMLQEGRSPGTTSPVTIVMISHVAREQDLLDAMKEVSLLQHVVETARAIRIEG